MGQFRGALIIWTVAVGLATAAPAQAVTLVPPGKAGADQYFETIPSSGGNAAPPAGAPGGTPGAALGALGHGRAGATALAHLGADGKAAAALAGATAPSPAAGSTRAGASSSGGSSPVSGVVKGLANTTSGGLGLVLPLLLASVLVLALGVVGRKLVRHQQPPELGA